jgi:hypothetical protein
MSYFIATFYTGIIRAKNPCPDDACEECDGHKEGYIFEGEAIK